jgi:hypothetical protein
VQQTEEFLQEVVYPLLEQNRGAYTPLKATLNV